MRIIIAGGSGLIGTALANLFTASGHQVWILTRNPEGSVVAAGATPVRWDGYSTDGWEALVSQTDAIVNLAGDNLGSGYWTRKKKDRVLTSRTNAGKAINDAIQRANPKPGVLIQASAVGFYGPHGNEPVTEETGPGQGFLAEICQAWEASSQPVEEMGVRRVVIRTGVVLAKSAGALPRMTLPFSLFAGGPIGNGRQGIPWIHLADEVAAIQFLLQTNSARGVFNLSAPEPLSNGDFGRLLAKVIRRPYWLPVPPFALRFILGEMSTLVIDGQFMVPKRLLDIGYSFKFANAEKALKEIYSREN
jgi:uncharacterized protein (TIGR01777 family)